jgi:hypothetical protein
MSYSASELILNPDGSVYHLGLRGEDIPNLVFTVGDPDRVSSITAHFDQIHWTKIRREFNIVRGTLKGQEVLVLSTGMGTDNIDIVMNELDAAVNIDPVTREDRPSFRKLTIIRIGTSGAIDPNLPLGTHLCSTGALSFDGLLPFTSTTSKPWPLKEPLLRPFLFQQRLAGTNYLLSPTSKPASPLPFLDSTPHRAAPFAPRAYSPRPWTTSTPKALRAPTSPTLKWRPPASMPWHTSWAMRPTASRPCSPIVA